jgi:hypothetical protein
MPCFQIGGPDVVIAVIPLVTIALAQPFSLRACCCTTLSVALGLNWCCRCCCCYCFAIAIDCRNTWCLVKDLWRLMLLLRLR